MLYLALVSVIWAFSFGLIGSALSGVDSFLVATLRLGVASLIFLPFLRLREIGSIDRFRLIIFGAIQFGLMYACYMWAYQFIPSHLVAIFSILTPYLIISWAIEITLSEGRAKPTPSDPPDIDAIEIFIPINSPLWFIKAPPELPRFIEASVWKIFR